MKRLTVRMRACAATQFSVALCTIVASIAPATAFDLQAHRGGRGLFPENTLAAFRGALAVGVDTLETDLAVTRDDVLVLSHEPALSPDLVRGPDGRWLAARGPLIRTLTLAELSQYDVGRLNPETRYGKSFPEQVPRDGERIPTLASLFALAAAHPKPVRLNIETKVTPTEPGNTVDAATFARSVVEAIRTASTGAAGPPRGARPPGGAARGAVRPEPMSDRVTVQSFDWRTLVEVRRLAPEIETACLTIESRDLDTVRADASGASPWHAGLRRDEHGGSLPRLVKAAGCGTWSMFWRNLRADDVRDAHAAGIKVLPWTVNDPAEMARLIDWKVDGIITDYPDRLRKVMEAKALPLP